MQWIIAVLGGLFELFGFFEYALGVGQNAFPGWGDANGAFGVAFKQLHAKLLFKLAHGDTQGRLADVADIGGTAEMALAGDGKNVTEFGKSHE